jgi:hypothetical protein
MTRVGPKNIIFVNISFNALDFKSKFRDQIEVSKELINSTLFRNGIPSTSETIRRRNALIKARQR